MRRGAPRSTRISLVVTLLLIVVLSVGLIGVSPLALDVFHGSASHWNRLSSIGQTYGAASAVLSVLAVIGVAVTLVLQARDSRSIRLQAIRESHTRLLEMAMNDPELNKVWGPSGLSDPFVQQRQSMYANMIVSQWEMSYATRTLTDDHLRLLAAEFLSGTIGRDFWTLARRARLDTSESKLNRRFHEIIDEEYRRLLNTPAMPPPEPGELHNNARDRRWNPLAIGLAVAGLGIVIRLIRRQKYRSFQVEQRRDRL
ncbi:hypothetical protein GCM10023196_025160 [Actinoallomurus vinaceus]|uniref:DUF4760 domain-containing protein n=1 Tax=Actinoallomurus vinaceus TaxID=1080074 RepID=A0ABP8U9M4_9ACTN